MKAFKSFYHTFRFWSSVSVLSIILGSFAILAGCIDRSGNMPHNTARLWSRWVCKINRIRVVIHGLEHINRHRSQIFVANHQGYFDIFALMGYLPVQLRWVAKASLFRIPFVGWSMRAARYISVDRDSKKKAYRAFLETIETVKAGNSVVIFPEGTRSLDGTIGPFKKGSHLLALRSQAPMVPVTIVGSGNIIRKGSAKIYPGSVRIVISAPVQFNPKAEKHDNISLEEIRNTICRVYDEILAGNVIQP